MEISGGASDALVIAAVYDVGATPEVFAINMPLRCCHARADTVALMFVVVVGQWASEVARSNIEVQLTPMLGLATVWAI